MTGQIDYNHKIAAKNDFWPLVPSQNQLFAIFSEKNKHELVQNTYMSTFITFPNVVIAVVLSLKEIEFSSTLNSKIYNTSM
jgi:hypothetical protein